eukprot:TRINITY_DN100975_c0_g1_i1.p1 TRINITY_DN100975_c0_g1~~TRINITY_DN100975_c0_g1_i1.p1  ORF type:complete len:535 (-),score=59.33 TRINITY_DN100975_c0_g1_i1:54-1658(-)
MVGGRCHLWLHAAIAGVSLTVFGVGRESWAVPDDASLEDSSAESLRASAPAAAEVVSDLSSDDASSGDIARSRLAATSATVDAEGNVRQDSQHLQGTEWSLRRRRTRTQWPLRQRRTPPRSRDDLSSANKWLRWPNLTADIELAHDCVVLMRYQTATGSGRSHIFSKLQVNDEDVPASRSVSGDSAYATTFGLYAAYLPQGRHKVSAFYRASGPGEATVPTRPELTNWEQRSLSLLAVPEATLLRVHPTWSFRLSDTDVFSAWSGLTYNLSLNDATPVLAVYSVAVDSRNSQLVTSLYRNDTEEPEARSVAASAGYAQNTGFYADYLQPGTHQFTLKYRSLGRDNHFLPEGGDYQTRVLNVFRLPGAIFYKAVDKREFLLQTNAWVDWPGLNTQFELEASRYVMATYSVALRIGRSQEDVSELVPGSLAAKMYLNGEELKASRSVCGRATHCHNLGMWMGPLPAGKHNVTVKYRTPTDGVRIRALWDDFSTRALTVVVMPGSASKPSADAQGGFEARRRVRRFVRVWSGKRRTR